MACCCRQTVLDSVASRAREAEVFGDIRTEGERLVCAARDSAEPAEYRVEWDEGGAIWVSLVTADRWLSESIEADLMHTGDKLEELLEDELVDLGHEGGALRVEHFRSDDLLFTFRSKLPGGAADDGAAAHAAAICLLAYEACFRQLGDMSGEED